MPRINRSVAGMILLAALDFKEGKRSDAAKRLQRVAEHADFEETLDGLNDMATESENDPFADLNIGSADDDEEFDFDADDLEVDEEQEACNASLVRGAKAKKKQVATDLEDGDSPGDTDNDNPTELRPEVARLRRIRQNLRQLAACDSK